MDPSFSWFIAIVFIASHCVLATRPISVEAIADQAGANLAADTIRVNKLSVVQRRRQAQMIQKNSLRQTRSENRTGKHWREN